MSGKIEGIVLLAGLFAVPLLSSGCRPGDDTIPITQMQLNDEEVASIRSQDQVVNEEEGGASRRTQSSRAKKIR